MDHLHLPEEDRHQRLKEVLLCLSQASHPTTQEALQHSRVFHKALELKWQPRPARGPSILPLL